MSGERKKRLDEVYDLEDMTCEKHVGHKWPHIMIFPWPSQCPGPGIPRKIEPATSEGGE